MTSIDILQSSNGSGARNFSEEDIADEKSALVDVASKESGRASVGEGGIFSFFANMPKDLTVSDLVIGKDKFKNIEEQREYFEREMLELAKDEEGWALFGKTNAEVDDSDQLDIYAKTFDWSPVRCFRTSVKEANVGPVKLMDFIQQDFEVQIENNLRPTWDRASLLTKKAVANVIYPFIHRTETVLSCIQYRVVELPCGYKQSSRIDAHIRIYFCTFALYLNTNVSALFSISHLKSRARNKSLCPYCK